MGNQREKMWQGEWPGLWLPEDTLGPLGRSQREGREGDRNPGSLSTSQPLARPNNKPREGGSWMKFLRLILQGTKRGTGRIWESKQKISSLKPVIQFRFFHVSAVQFIQVTERL